MTLIVSTVWDKKQFIVILDKGMTRNCMWQPSTVVVIAHDDQL